MKDQLNEFDPDPSIADSPPRNSPTNEMLDSLQSVLAEFEAIASAWRQRLGNPMQAVQSEVATNGESHKLNPLKNHPESEVGSDYDIEALRELQDQLIDAWHRLESEQQQFALVQGQKPNPIGHSPGRSNKIAPAKSISSPAAIHPVNCVTHPSSAGPHSEAIRQFHRLRCEMESLKSPQTSTSLETRTHCGD